VPALAHRRLATRRVRGKSNLQRLQRLQLSTSQITNFHQNHLLEPSWTRIQLVPTLDMAPLRHAGNTCPCHYEAGNPNGRVDPQPPNYQDASLNAIRAAISINFIDVAQVAVTFNPAATVPLPSTLGQGFNITLASRLYFECQGRGWCHRAATRPFVCAGPKPFLATASSSPTSSRGLKLFVALFKCPHQ